MKPTKKIGTDAIVIYPEGKLHIHAVLVLEEMVNIAIEENPGCNVLIDLSDVEHLSSSCLRLFVGTQAKLLNKGLKLKLFNPNIISKKILDITELNTQIDVYDTEEDAVQSLRK
jgi:anti-anti-sigma factor